MKKFLIPIFLVATGISVILACNNDPDPPDAKAGPCNDIYDPEVAAFIADSCNCPGQPSHGCDTARVEWFMQTGCDCRE